MLAGQLHHQQSRSMKAVQSTKQESVKTTLHKYNTNKFSSNKASYDSDQ